MRLIYQRAQIFRAEIGESLYSYIDEKVEKYRLKNRFARSILPLLSFYPFDETNRADNDCIQFQTLFLVR